MHQMIDRRPLMCRDGLFIGNRKLYFPNGRTTTFKENSVFLDFSRKGVVTNV